MPPARYPTLNRSEAGRLLPLLLGASDAMLRTIREAKAIQEQIGAIYRAGRIRERRSELDVLLPRKTKLYRGLHKQVRIHNRVAWLLAGRLSGVHPPLLPARPRLPRQGSPDAL